MVSCLPRVITCLGKRHIWIPGASRGHGALCGRGPVGPWICGTGPVGPQPPPDELSIPNQAPLPSRPGTKYVAQGTLAAIFGTSPTGEDSATWAWALLLPALQQQKNYFDFIVILMWGGCRRPHRHPGLCEGSSSHPPVKSAFSPDQGQASSRRGREIIL